MEKTIAIFDRNSYNIRGTRANQTGGGIIVYNKYIEV